MHVPVIRIIVIQLPAAITDHGSLLTDTAEGITGHNIFFKKNAIKLAKIITVSQLFIIG